MPPTPPIERVTVEAGPLDIETVITRGVGSPEANAEPTDAPWTIGAPGVLGDPHEQI